MILVIDIGNTNIVAGCVEGKEILFRERLSTAHRATMLEYGVLFKTAFEMHGIDYKKIEGGKIESNATIFPWRGLLWGVDATVWVLSIAAIAFVTAKYIQGRKEIE